MRKGIYMELLGSALLAKYAPVIFLSVSPKGITLNVEQLAHTLIVSAIVAGVTMYGTQRVLEIQMQEIRDSHKVMLTKIDDMDKRIRDVEIHAGKQAK